MRRTTFYIIGVMAFLLVMAGCASMGTPSGGPRDEDPPRFMGANPPMGAVEVTPQKVVLTFDELVGVKDAFTKVVVSPPSKQTPRVSALGRRVTVEFRDTLLPNTTYTVDFGDAIVDNNEGNKLEGFMYTFSTGEVLDSLMVSGMVLGAEDLAPMEGIYVGLHTDLADSAFMKTRFDRIAKTDENGKFVIGGLAPGEYRIFALDDRDGDLAWSSPDETLAFYHTVLSPYSEQTQATDSIFDLKTGAVDSVVMRRRTRFLPNNILLRPYNTGFKQQYITKYERVDSTRLDFIFNAPADSMPKVELVVDGGSSIPLSQIAVQERSMHNDTISFWLRDPSMISRDTLRVAMEYLRADSAYNMVPVNDTLRMLTVRMPVKDKDSKVKKDSKKAPNDSIEEAPEVPTLEIKALNAKPEVYQQIVLQLPSPVDTFDFTMIHLDYKEDSLYLKAPDFDVGLIAFDTINPRLLKIDYPWKYGTEYRLTVDSLAGKGIYGLYTDDLQLNFTTRAQNEYGSLRFNLSNMGVDSIPRFVQLLDAQGKPIAKQRLENGSVTFEYLLAGKYNARVVEDLNGDMEWTPGNFELGIPPDVTYYYPLTVELKSNWDQEIDWNVFSTPVDQMLPETLRKNTSKNKR